MKRSTPVLLPALILIFTFVSVSHAQYTIIQLTHNLYDDPGYKINENGHVVWGGCFHPACGPGYEGDHEILLYDGTSTTQLTNNDHGDGSPQINSSGDVVWYGSDGSDYEIFLYDGTSTTQITDNDYSDGSPQINDNGEMVWLGAVDSSSQIFFFDGTSTTQVTNTDNYKSDCRINGNGYVVWRGCDGEVCGVGGDGDNEIYLYDGTNTIQLTNNEYDDYKPQISDNGYVVWHGCDGTDCRRREGDFEIFLYDGTTTTQLTDNAYDDMVPQINSSGSVVWRGGNWSDTEIFIYDGTSTTQLSTGDFLANTAPQIDSNGYVVWEGCDSGYCDPAGGPGVYGDTEILLYDGTSTARITNNSRMDGEPQMNDRGEIVWWSWETDSWNSGIFNPQIRLVIPCSLDDDNDDDGYVSVACGGDDCNDGDPAVNPGMSESEVIGNCSDWKDNDCDGSPDCNDPDCPDCPTSCAGNAAASTLGATSVHGASDLGKHLAFFLLPVGAVIGLRIWCNTKG
jgi:hypothetical protein